MRLVTVKTAASELFVSPGMIAYWKRHGLVTTYPYHLTPLSAKVRKRTVSTYRYLVDLEELTRLRDRSSDPKLLTEDKRLLRPKEIAKILDVKIDRVYRWVRIYGLKKYCPNPGAQKNYFLDGDEVADLLEDIGLGYLIK
jgi:hypothetical protein